MNPKIIFNWSGGKDSALALHRILQERRSDVMCLLTTVSARYDRISMHGVRVSLLEDQAAAIGIPLKKLYLPDLPDMETYESAIGKELSVLRAEGATACAFGDIFLEDLRKYREDKLAPMGLKAVFPLWGIPTDRLIREFIDSGFRTVITCVNDKYLDRSFAGRIIDHDLLKDLPPDVDPCGENGEFHTFVFEGPLFSNPVLFDIGETVHRKYEAGSSGDDKGFDTGFWYCDLIPVADRVPLF